MKKTKKEKEREKFIKQFPTSRINNSRKIIRDKWKREDELEELSADYQN
jgi:hypothetical protein